MNIVVGKIGKSVLFNPKSWGSIGGDNEAPKYYENLFHRNPEHTFYIYGGNDFSRLSLAERKRINKHGNVIDIWGGFADWRKANKSRVTEREANIVYLSEWHKENSVKMNCAVIFAGPAGTANVEGKTTTMKQPDVIANPIEMLCKYSGPLISFLNDTETPYALIVNDPRYFPSNARDLFHRPSVVLSQYEEVAKTVTKTSYRSSDTKTVQVKTAYSQMETIFLIGLTRGGTASAIEPVNTLDAFFNDSPPQPVEGEKDINFMIVLNEGRPSRYKPLKEAILNDVQDVDIYGKWDPEVIGDDKRFKGSISFHDLQNMLPRVKYTFCIPIKKGWVTSKFWEMAHYGIIPFLHQTYDEQDHLKAPAFLKVKNSKDLFNKIKFLEENPQAYETLRASIDDMLKDGYYNGEILNDLTMKHLKEIALP